MDTLLLDVPPMLSEFHKLRLSPLISQGMGTREHVCLCERDGVGMEREKRK